MARPDVTIHKTSFTPFEKMVLTVPHGTRVVHIDEQDRDGIFVWYERPVHGSFDVKTITLYCFPTGAEIDTTNLRIEYFKTVVQRNGLVWHFYLGVD